MLAMQSASFQVPKLLKTKGFIQDWRNQSETNEPFKYLGSDWSLLNLKSHYTGFAHPEKHSLQICLPCKTIHFRLAQPKNHKEEDFIPLTSCRTR